MYLRFGLLFRTEISNVRNFLLKVTSVSRNRLSFSFRLVQKAHTARYGTIQYGIVRYGAVRYGRIRYGTIRYVYGTCTVRVRYVYGTCTERVRYVDRTCTVCVRSAYSTVR